MIHIINCLKNLQCLTSMEGREKERKSAKVYGSYVQDGAGSFLEGRSHARTPSNSLATFGFLVAKGK